MQKYYERNDPLHRRFLALLDAQTITEEFAKTFSQDVMKLHNVQWSEHIFNIASARVQCANDCAYCYMRNIRTRFFGAAKPEETTVAIEDIAPVDAKRVAKKWRKVKRETERKLIMFPSSHDILPTFVNEFISSAQKILEAGHSLLIVTKPRMACLARVAEALDANKDRIIYRLTITSTDQRILNIWEPHAPQFTERFDVLRMLHARGCLTSVSIEPFLGDVRETIRIVAPFVSETIWIGTMSGITTMKNKAATTAATPATATTTPTITQEEFARVIGLYDISELSQVAHDIHITHRDELSGAKVRWKAHTMAKIALFKSKKA